MRLITEGRNRLVLVTGRWALKLPSVRSWRDFLFGLLNNLNEASWHREQPDYCPVSWSAPLGLMLVMPRARILGHEEYAGLAGALPELPVVEAKASSWGWLRGELVAVDYGWR